MLIPFARRQIGTDTVNTVNARDLYAFLEVKQRFNDWITKRIAQYGFVQGIDFTRYYDSSSANPNPPIEYYLSFEMCKELSMVEKTAKGKEARLWFLECEREVLERPSHKALTTAEMFLAQAHINVEFEQRASAIEARQEEQALQIAALVERQPPADKFRIEDWLRRHSKPFLPKPVLAHLRATCRDMEDPDMFRPENYDYLCPYYSPYTIAAAYEQATRQLSFFSREASVAYRR
jgi:phage anti-repressor protein